MISISGIDCCGKSTQIELLCEELKRAKMRGCMEPWGIYPGNPGSKRNFQERKKCK